MDRAAAEAADAADPLRALRGRFALPEGVIYLDGNSLGALQPAVARRLRDVVDLQWGVGLIRSWNEAGWLELPRRIATRLATIVGAHAHEIAVAGTTTTDLFKVLAAARGARPGRPVVLTDDTNFPTDVYVAGGLAELVGDTQLRVVPTDEIGTHLDGDVAVVFLTHVDYRTGRLHDAAALTAAAHEAGALAVWDLSHSTGAVDVDLHAWDADLAVGCSYKYLNGGPGAPAFLYIAERHHDVLANPIRGWFGHARPFDFDLRWEPAYGAERYLDGTPPVLSMAALDAALEVWDGLDPAAVAAKGRALTRRFVELVTARCGDAVEVVSPRDPGRRGAQVSLRHQHAYALTQALIARGVIGDHRPPDLLRLGFSPLYVTHTDVWDAVDVLAQLLDTGAWDRPEHHRRRTVI